MHSQGVEERVLRSVWGVAPAATRGPRARYDLAEITATGVALADSGGLSGVALSAVSRELGLTTTALYRYVDSKETLVQLMVDAAIGPPPRVTTDDWHDAVQAWVSELWARYREHPWLAEVHVAGMPLYPQRLGWMETLLCELDRGPVSDPMRVALLLDGLTRSFALLARPADDATPPSWVVEAAAARYPRLAHEFTRNWTNIEGELAPAVRTVLAGAERPTDPSPRAGAPA
jgi:AcrR family transcriptional regulator